MQKNDVGRGPAIELTIGADKSLRFRDLDLGPWHLWTLNSTFAYLSRSIFLSHLILPSTTSPHLVCHTVFTVYARYRNSCPLITRSLSHRKLFTYLVISAFSARLSIQCRLASWARIPCVLLKPASNPRVVATTNTPRWVRYNETAERSTDASNV